MSDLVPEYLTYDYRCTFRGIPGVHHDLDDYPIFWTVKVKGRVWDDEDEGDGKEVTVGEAELYIVPDAGIIDLFLTLDAVNQEVANIGEMLTVNRPDLIHEMSLGGDLLILSRLKVVPRFRGNKLGHSMLKAVLSTIGRSSTKVIIEATPPLTDNGLIEGSPEYLAGKAALRRYLESFGFQPAHGDYLVLDDMADSID